MLVVELIVQVFKPISNKSSGRKMSVVRVKKEETSCKCPHITIVLLSVLQFWKKCQNECSIEPVLQLFLTKRGLYVIK